MKNVLKKIVLVVIILGVIACIAVSIPSILKMTKDLSATPEPGAPLTLEAACEFYDKIVEIEGRLELPNQVSCTSEAPLTCQVDLFDPYWQRSVTLNIPVYNGVGDPPANQMALLPDSFSTSDFYVQTADNRAARDGSFVSVRGKENHSGSNCSISSIESIQLLDRLVVDVAPDLTSLTLQEALSQGVVLATITGNGLSQITLSLKPNVELNYEIIIEPGTLFISGTEGVQNMVVRQEQIVYLKPNLEISLELEVSCANMTLKEPSFSDVFSVSTDPVNPDLLRLLNSEGFTALDLNIQQFAVWTITDNPYDLYSYTGIMQGDYSLTPDEGTVQLLKILFEQAGIDTTQYSVFIQ